MIPEKYKVGDGNSDEVYLENTDGTSNKFYLMKKTDKGVCVWYGRIERQGFQTHFYPHGTPNKSYHSILNSKLKKGYAMLSHIPFHRQYDCFAGDSDTVIKKKFDKPDDAYLDWIAG